MAHVTFIHSILNKPAPEVLLKIWQDALLAGGGVDPAAHGVTSSMVYWADVLYPAYEGDPEAVETIERTGLEAAPRTMELGPALPVEMPGSEERFVAKLAARFEAVAGGLDRDLPDVSGGGDVGMERVPLPWFIKRPFMEMFLRDVHHYLFNVEHSPRPGSTYHVRDEIRRRTVEALGDGARKRKPHIVVAHSMGTVIAYDCLKRVANCPPVDGLMTIGSPLGLDEIQDQFQPEWTREDGFPGKRLEGRWVNVFDHFDPVAGFDPWLANDYQSHGTAVVEDVNEQNFGRWRHDIVKYLAGRSLRQALLALLGLGHPPQDETLGLKSFGVPTQSRAMRKRPSKGDSYLRIASSATLQDMPALDHEAEAVLPEVSQTKYPMLIRIRDPQTWTPPEGFETQSRLGGIVAGRGTQQVIQVLEEDPDVLSVEGSREAGMFECAQSLPFVKVGHVHHGNPAETGDRVLVGIVDGGIDVLHQAFHDANGHPRIVEIWDQGDSSGPPPSAVYADLQMDYGSIHRAADIDGYVASGNVPARLGRDPIGHGTHVASIAAGQPAGQFAGGIASEARIVVVIPRIRANPADPVSIGYSQSHADALAYLREVAHQRDLPIVVNVSLGMNAGAHDGTSLLEAAFDAFSGGGREPGLVVVKSAGNERGHAGHAKLTLGSRAKDVLAWKSLADPRTEDLIELWFRSCDELKFRLIDPGGILSAQCDWSNTEISGSFPSGNKYFLSYTRYHPDNGDSRLTVAIRCGNLPATHHGLPAAIRVGEWKLQIESGRVCSQAEVHAWVERVNSRPVMFLTHLNEGMTLSIPGTARSVITVGAVNSSFPLQNTDSSSYGPTRDHREKPDVVAPGDGVVAARAGTADGAVAMTGTSMAAPHVTGAVALVLSYCTKQPGRRVPNAAQLRAALVQTAQNFNGFHTVNSGYGVLDAEAIFKALV